jgi:uncharacterized protein
MRYWDASAVVPLVLDEPGTALVRSWLRDDAAIVTWGLTRLEVVAAVERAARDRRLSTPERREILGRFDDLFAAFSEVVDLSAVRSRALALLARHALRSADAAQLASALLVAEGDPSSLEMVCLDRRLADAADREGLRVLSWARMERIDFLEWAGKEIGAPYPGRGPSVFRVTGGVGLGIDALPDATIRVHLYEHSKQNQESIERLAAAEGPDPNVSRACVRYSKQVKAKYGFEWVARNPRDYGGETTSVRCFLSFLRKIAEKELDVTFST